MSNHEHHDLDPSTLHTAEFWDERYGSADALWSGRPNQRLVENVTGLAAGKALEIGCGEGADAIWLAQQGWSVTAVDVSQVALDRAAHHAAREAPAIRDRITWRREDLREWAPEPASFDLVTEHFLHLPSALRVRQHARLASAVRPGGVLLLVGHHPVDHRTLQRPHAEDLYFLPEQEASALSPDDWDVSATAPSRPAHGPDGSAMTVTDAVVRAVRRR
jgi:2-polyprenyl-3-methyl-5-hydroxy-6-metoxy-1,4-benzoquinol methylase